MCATSTHGIVDGDTSSDGGDVWADNDDAEYAEQPKHHDGDFPDGVDESHSDPPHLSADLQREWLARRQQFYQVTLAPLVTSVCSTLCACLFMCVCAFVHHLHVNFQLA